MIHKSAHKTNDRRILFTLSFANGLPNSIQSFRKAAGALEIIGETGDLASEHICLLIDETDHGVGGNRF